MQSRRPRRASAGRRSGALRPGNAVCERLLWDAAKATGEQEKKKPGRMKQGEVGGNKEHCQSEHLGLTDGAKGHSTVSATSCLCRSAAARPCAEIPCRLLMLQRRQAGGALSRLYCLIHCLILVCALSLACESESIGTASVTLALGESVAYWFSFSNPRTECIHCDNCLHCL